MQCSFVEEIWERGGKLNALVSWPAEVPCTAEEALQVSLSRSGPLASLASQDLDTFHSFDCRWLPGRTCREGIVQSTCGFKRSCSLSQGWGYFGDVSSRAERQRLACRLYGRAGSYTALIDGGHSFPPARSQLTRLSCVQNTDTMDLPSPLPFLATLLPYLLSPEPTILPASFLSTPTTHHHTFLDPSPASPSYLQLLPSPLVEPLRESLSTLPIEDVEIGDARYNIEEGEVRSRIPLGLAGLAVVLMWEETSYPDGEHERPSWTFLSLAAIPAPGTPPIFYHSLAEALDQAGRNRPGPIEIRAREKEDVRADGEGTTPGAYGAAEDFWEGWEEDAPSGGEEEKVEEKESGHAGDYWERYGSVESVLGEEREVKGVTRSRRSSTIRAKASPNGTLLDSTPVVVQQGFELPSAQNGVAKENGVEKVSNGLVEGREEENLRFALAGLWGLYGGKGAGEEKKEAWMRIAAQVVRS